MAGRMMRYDPYNTFPYRLSPRLHALSVPRRSHDETTEPPPAYTELGVRRSALNAQLTDRINDIAWPWLRRLVITRKMYKNRFSQERLDRIDRMIEAANATVYSKLANCVVDLKKQDTKDPKKKKGWTESEWKRHMDYINAVAAPKKVPEPPPVERGKSKPLQALMPGIQRMTSMPDFKYYRRPSKEPWYRNPEKVSPKALKYVLTERTKKLAAPRTYPAHN